MGAVTLLICNSTLTRCKYCRLQAAPAPHARPACPPLSPTPQAQPLVSPAAEPACPSARRYTEIYGDIGRYMEIRGDIARALPHAHSQPSHPRTPAPPHPCTSAPPHLRTSAPLHLCTSAPPHPRACAPLHPCTCAPAHHPCTFTPLHPRACALARPCTRAPASPLHRRTSQRALFGAEGAAALPYVECAAGGFGAQKCPPEVDGFPTWKVHGAHTTRTVTLTGPALSPHPNPTPDPRQIGGKFYGGYQTVED